MLYQNHIHWSKVLGGDALQPIVDEADRAIERDGECRRSECTGLLPDIHGMQSFPFPLQPDGRACARRANAGRAGHNDDALISMGERWGFLRAWELFVREQ